MEYIDLWCIFKGCLLPSTTSRTPKTAKEADTQKLKCGDPFLGQGEVARAISSEGFQLMLRVLWCFGVCSLQKKKKKPCKERGYFHSPRKEGIFILH